MRYKHLLTIFHSDTIPCDMLPRDTRKNLSPSMIKKLMRDTLEKRPSDCDIFASKMSLTHGDLNFCLVKQRGIITDESDELGYI